MEGYSVKKLAKLAGVSVRTLHLYDQLGLLKPRTRTQARYRLYGETELLRLQQILFYKELDFPLQAIKAILDDPDFDFLGALQSHKAALQARRDRLATLLVTVDNTIAKLKGEPNMLTHEELYEGFPRERAEAYRQEAAQKWGADAVEKSEHHLRSLGKEAFARLKEESQEIWNTLIGMAGEDPASEAVQNQVARHYAVIRQFWGTAGSPDAQAEAYRGLGQLYGQDERYTAVDGQPNPAFAGFMSRAMSHFADTRLLSR
jgi:DNA-binding transcriptional MerR regulator